MKFIKNLFGWIINPISKCFGINYSDKAPKAFNNHPILIFLAASILTCLIVLGIYYL